MATLVLGYPRPALPSAGSLSVFGTIMASDWTDTKVAVYKAAVFTSLLDGCES